MGPASSDLQWSAATNKFKRVATAVAEMHSGPVISALNYNARAVSILTYLPQVTLPPESLWQLERHAASHALHFATSALDDQALFNLQQFGGTPIRNLKAVCAGNTQDYMVETTC